MELGGTILTCVAMFLFPLANWLFERGRVRRHCPTCTCFDQA